MNEFFDLYKKIKINPFNINTIGSEFINKGMIIYNNTNEIQIKEDILSKLIEFYPNEPAFYYFMGYSLKNIDASKALQFLEKSYKINPNNIENLIEYCNLLHEFGFSKKVIELDKMHSFGNNLKDIRLLNVFVNCKYKEFFFKDILKQLLYIIKSKSKTPAITNQDKEWKFSNYLNVGHIYCFLGDYKNAVFYNEKAFEICKKFHLEIKTILNCLCNLLALEDYNYHDCESHYNKTLQINDLYPNKKQYNYNIKHDKIRVGYVSGDFSNHAVSNFILPILKNHDLENFEIFLFCNQKEIWEKYKRLNFDCFCIYNMSMEDSANMINKLEIDILFDLNGYTDNNRLEIFSLNPSPIQISYLGYPNTTGLKSIQYRITDNVSDNIESSQKYSEKLIKMPNCFLLFESINQIKPIIPRKTGNVIILGSLNNEKKNSNELLETWKVILENCPNTKLLVKLIAYDDLIERQQFYMNKLNVGSERLIMITKVDNDGYNKLFSMVDIVLDTFPYSGTTTTCNSLFNSIPVVTLYNKHYHAHNVSSSILKNAGLDSLISYDNLEYINIVKNMINNPLLIDEYKNIIGKKFIDSMNPKTNNFMGSYENILKELYRSLQYEQIYV